jgi:hypothetical protein
LAPTEGAVLISFCSKVSASVNDNLKN